MINILSVVTLVGVFASAVNLICAHSPAAVIQMLGLTM